jgi:hypothetical protein
MSAKMIELEEVTMFEVCDMTLEQIGRPGYINTEATICTSAMSCDDESC